MFRGEREKEDILNILLHENTLYSKLFFCYFLNLYYICTV